MRRVEQRGEIGDPQATSPKQPAASKGREVPWDDRESSSETARPRRDSAATGHRRRCRAPHELGSRIHLSPHAVGQRRPSSHSRSRCSAVSRFARESRDEEAQPVWCRSRPRAKWERTCPCPQPDPGGQPEIVTGG